MCSTHRIAFGNAAPRTHLFKSFFVARFGSEPVSDWRLWTLESLKVAAPLTARLEDSRIKS